MKKYALTLLLSVQLATSGTILAQTANPSELTSQFEVQMLEQLIRRHPDQAMRIISKTLAAPAQTTASAPPVQAGALQVATSMPIDPEQALLERISNIPAAPKSLKIESYRDGFSVNGIRHVDPEGQITQYNYNTRTGNLTYLVRQSPQQLLVKFMRAGVPIEPVLLARANYSSDGWLVTTQTGKTLKGDYLLMASLGFLVARSNSAFYYQPGERLNSVSAPQGYVIARFQNGDISNTNYVLLERPPVDTSNNVVAAAGAFFSALSSLAGNDRNDTDYVLFNLRTGHQVNLNIASDGKDIAIGRNCRAQNALINVCQQMQSYEALYDKMGLPNITHYFWRIHWYATDKGPLAVTLENGLKEVRVRDLDSEKKAVAFQRDLGISALYSNQGSDGRVTVKASLAFTDSVLEDARDWLDSQP